MPSGKQASLLSASCLVVSELFRKRFIPAGLLLLAPSNVLADLGDEPRTFLELPVLILIVSFVSRGIALSTSTPWLPT
jgi:hypothetical protein